MINSTQIANYVPISYIHYGLYFLYLRCILFLNTIDTIVFSNMLLDDNTPIHNNNSVHTHSRRHNSFNSVGRDIETQQTFGIFDINKTTILNEHTQNQINYMDNLLFSDYEFSDY